MGLSTFVSGLVMRFMDSTNCTSSHVAGPAVYAAVGAGLQTKVNLVAALSTDVSNRERDRLTSLNIDMACCEPRDEPSLLLDVVALRRGASSVLSANPIHWTPRPMTTLESSDALLAANGDPHWLMKTIEASTPYFVAMDLHATWMRARRTSLEYCINRADFITGTEAEFAYWAGVAPNHVTRRSSVRLVKRGPNGVLLSSGGLTTELSAPTSSQSQPNDVGAGDLLLGLVGGGAIKRAKGMPPLLSHYVEAYEEARAFLSILLASGGADDFLTAIEASLGMPLPA